MMPLNLGSLIPSFRHFQLVFVGLRLNLPSFLANGPKTIESIADATRVPVSRLERLLRGLLWAGVITGSTDGFVLSEEGKKLIDRENGSLASDILFQGHFFIPRGATFTIISPLEASPLPKHMVAVFSI
jgi:hypothetical protein